MISSGELCPQYSQDPHPIVSTQLLSAPRSLHRLHDARRSRRARSNLSRLLSAIVPLKDIARPPLEQARVLDRRRVTKVGIHARNHREGVDGPDVLEDGLARDLSLAVATGAVDLAVLGGQEVLDRNGAAAVVLEDLVGCVAGAAAIDVRRAQGLEEGCGVFADVGPPSIGNNWLGPVYSRMRIRGESFTF
jgi:hypothetical protein